MEIGEAPPVADEASRFRGSSTIGPNGRANRNAATVTSEFTFKIISRLRTLGQPLAALLLYGCRIPLADVKVCDAFYSHCPFSYNFSFARAYNSRVREKLKGMVQ
jgi:hypothetical protein